MEKNVLFCLPQNNCLFSAYYQSLHGMRLNMKGKGSCGEESETLIIQVELNSII